MDNRQEAECLRLADDLRRKSDAIVIVGFLPAGRMFWSVDERIALPDLHFLLRNAADDVCGSVSRTRGRAAKERSS